MSEWLANLAGEGYATALIWTLGALILLLVLLVVARIVRNFTSGTFVAGGRNRAPRLAVVDAAAVDSQRRLVLVRRDDVEHLILIGGPSDVVVEQQIRARDAEAGMPQRPRREAPAPAQPTSARPRPTPVPRPVPPVQEPPSVSPGRGVSSPERAPQVRLEAASAPAVSAPQRSRPVEPEPLEAQRLRREEPQMTGTTSGSWQRREREPERQADARFSEETDVSVNEPAPGEPADESVSQRADLSIEDEMSRLLDDLAEERKKEG